MSESPKKKGMSPLLAALFGLGAGVLATWGVLSMSKRNPEYDEATESVRHEAMHVWKLFWSGGVSDKEALRLILERALRAKIWVSKDEKKKLAALVTQKRAFQGGDSREAMFFFANSVADVIARGPVPKPPTMALSLRPPWERKRGP